MGQSQNLSAKVELHLTGQKYALEQAKRRMTMERFAYRDCFQDRFTCGNAEIGCYSKRLGVECLGRLINP
jgi:hypothetical protein